MRVNVYSQEITDEVILIKKKSNTGIVYTAVQFILHSSDKLHHSSEDDDRSAVTFWLPKSKTNRVMVARAFKIAARLIETDGSR